jgi:hypothetical protein
MTLSSPVLIPVNSKRSTSGTQNGNNKKKALGGTVSQLERHSKPQLHADRLFKVKALRFRQSQRISPTFFWIVANESNVSYCKKVNLLYTRSDQQISRAHQSTSNELTDHETTVYRYLSERGKTTLRYGAVTIDMNS